MIGLGLLWTALLGPALRVVSRTLVGLPLGVLLLAIMSGAGIVGFAVTLDLDTCARTAAAAQSSAPPAYRHGFPWSLPGGGAMWLLAASRGPQTRDGPSSDSPRPEPGRNLVMQELTLPGLVDGSRRTKRGLYPPCVLRKGPAKRSPPGLRHRQVD